MQIIPVFSLRNAKAKGFLCKSCILLGYVILVFLLPSVHNTISVENEVRFAVLPKHTF